VWSSDHPAQAAYQIDPVHLSYFLANRLGYLASVGAESFLSSYRFRKPLPEVYRSIVPMCELLLMGVLVAVPPI
jgi:hypothetical protein